MPATEELTQVEKDKLEIDPDFDFREIAERPFGELTPNEIGMFKWSGVYHQLQKGYFMIRLRIPGGLLTADQLARAGELAGQYGQNELCITTRQCLQFHWVRQQDIYKIIEGMGEVGILTKNACGDVCRNVVSCSLQGVCPHEQANTQAMVMALADDPVLRDQLRNLPRKHKISVNGCGTACGQGLMNCQGWYAVTRKTTDGTEEHGWAFSAGGGLGALPHMGKMIFDWVPDALVVPVARAVVESHNRHGNRRKRKYARLKIVVAEMGASRFAECLFGILKENGVTGLAQITLAADSTPALKPFPYAGQAVIPQRQADLSTIRIMIPRSEMTGEEVKRFAAWADTLGGNKIMFTNRQNLELRDVPEANVQPLLAAITDAGYRTDGHDQLPDVVACVGTTMCNLAVADTPNTYRMLVDAFGSDRELSEKVGPLRINMNGCPNSCAHHWIADIGLRGKRRRTAEGSEEGFSLFAGGRLDAAGHIGEQVIDIAASAVVPTIRTLLELYLDERSEGEEFGAYARRIGGVALGLLLTARLRVTEQEPTNMRNLHLENTLNSVFEEAK
jgi:ferredoxin-nitrite reductase